MVKVKVTGFSSSENYIFKVYILRHLQWELANDHQCLNYNTMSKFAGAGFFIFVLVFVSHDLELGGALRLVRPQKGFLVCRQRSMTDA